MDNSQLISNFKNTETYSDNYNLLNTNSWEYYLNVGCSAAACSIYTGFYLWLMIKYFGYFNCDKLLIMAVFCIYFGGRLALKLNLLGQQASDFKDSTNLMYLLIMDNFFICLFQLKILEYALKYMTLTAVTVDEWLKNKAKEKRTLFCWVFTRCMVATSYSVILIILNHFFQKDHEVQFFPIYALFQIVLAFMLYYGK